MISSRQAVTLSTAAALAALFNAPASQAATIDNGVAAGAIGAVTANIESGGEVTFYNLTGQREDTGQIVTEDLIFDYTPIINIGSSGFELGTTGNTATANGGVVTSSGSFQGAAGNTIDWVATSTLGAGSTLLSTRYDFTAQTGTLGDVELYQYLDEDVFAVSDDIFFERGTLAGEDLQLFTIDGASALGVAQSGAFSAAGGLSNATYLGYAADAFNELQGGLANGTRGVTLDGDIDLGSLPAGSSPLVGGTVFGPNDVVSALGWQLDANATSASVLTTLGGVPQITDIPDVVPVPTPGPPPAPTPDPDPTAVPTPGAAVAGLLMLGGLAGRRRRR